MTGGFEKWGDLWSLLITKFYSVVEIKGDQGSGACRCTGEGRDNAGIGVETWGKQITGKTLLEMQG